MKTVKQILSEIISDPVIQQMAIENTGTKRSLVKCEGNSKAALCAAFRWNDSPQGSEFWYRVYRNPGIRYDQIKLLAEIHRVIVENPIYLN